MSKNLSRTLKAILFLVLIETCLNCSDTAIPFVYALDFDQMPKIEFLSFPNSSTVYENYLDIEGTVSSPFGIDSVYIDGRKAALKDGIFTLAHASLTPGKNIFLIKVIDLLGNRMNFLYTVYREEAPKETIATKGIKDELFPQANTETKVPEEIKPKEEPKAEGFTESYKSKVLPEASSGDKNAISGTRPVTVYTTTTYTTDTATNSGQAYQEAASPVVTQAVTQSSAPQDNNAQDNNASVEKNTGKPIVTFSSPYSDQVITENSLQIGGSFDPSANISAIAVNGRDCTLDRVNSTFTGPTLISPGQARRDNKTPDSKDCIIMNVDPITHSGKNILKVVITNDLKRAFEEEITFYYYQLFVELHTDGAVVARNPLNGAILSVPILTMAYNPDLFMEPPEKIPYFHGWDYPDLNFRQYDYRYYGALIIYGEPGVYYYRKAKPFYFVMKNPLRHNPLLISLGSNRFVYSDNGTSEFETKVTLHTPPLSTQPFILVFKDCDFLETSPILPHPFSIDPEWLRLQLDLNKYKIIYNSNTYTLMPLCGSFEKWSADGVTYVVINDFKPDTDFELKIEAPDYGEGFYSWYNDRHSKYFYCGVGDGITGDILVDSNNDGFLGGDDNAVEQVAPGCVLWVNEDDDYDESTVHENDANNGPFWNINSDGNDSADKVINGIRDLEDFMPINLTIPNIKEWLDPSRNVKFYLKSEGQGKIRIFKRVKDTGKEGSLTYLKNLGKSIEQFHQQDLPFDQDDGKKITLDANWFDSEGKFYGIFEGISVGALKLTLEVELGADQDKKTVVLDEAYITIKDIGDMYRFIDVRTPPSTDSGYGKLRYRIIDIQKKNMFIKDPSSIYIFIHGAWTSKRDAITWSNIVYKRLYRSGYRGGFIGFSWDTAKATDWPIPPFGCGNPKTEFDNEWIRSFQTGQALADVIENTKIEFKDAKINLMAHSLGGNLTSYALRLLAAQDKRKIVDNVFLIQAAVPGNTYATRTENDYFKDMYVLSAANNVTGKVYNLFYDADGTLDWFNKGLSGNFPSIILGKLGVPVPLDDNYELLSSNRMHGYSNVDYYRYERSASEALGRQNLTSKLWNFMSRYRKYKTIRPYGIRDHLSFGTEYYYDVSGYYHFIVYEEDEE